MRNHSFLRIRGSGSEGEEIKAMFYFPDVEMAIRMIAEKDEQYKTSNLEMVAGKEIPEERHLHHEWLIFPPGESQTFLIMKDGSWLSIKTEVKYTTVIPIPANTIHALRAMTKLHFFVHQQVIFSETNAED